MKMMRTLRKINKRQWLDHLKNDVLATAFSYA